MQSEQDWPTVDRGISIGKILPGRENPDWVRAVRGISDYRERFKFWTAHTAWVVEHRSAITYRAFRAIWDRARRKENERNENQETDAA